MNLYNALFGHTGLGPAVLAALNLKPGDVGRYRDAWVEKDSNGDVRLAVYTRNGGGNREHYDDAKDPGADCDCTGCTIKYRMPKHPLYLYDTDDDFDSTYATAYYRVPDEYRAEFEAIALDQPIDPSERWLKMLASLKAAR
jgi:hypothetical protein